MIAIAIKSYAP